jgi:hypothetical protein
VAQREWLPALLCVDLRVARNPGSCDRGRIFLGSGAHLLTASMEECASSGGHVASLEQLGVFGSVGSAFCALLRWKGR